MRYLNRFRVTSPRQMNREKAIRGSKNPTCWVSRTHIFTRTNDFLGVFNILVNSSLPFLPTFSTHPYPLPSRWILCKQHEVSRLPSPSTFSALSLSVGRRGWGRVVFSGLALVAQTLCRAVGDVHGAGQAGVVGGAAVNVTVVQVAALVVVVVLEAHGCGYVGRGNGWQEGEFWAEFEESGYGMSMGAGEGKDGIREARDKVWFYVL